MAGTDLCVSHLGRTGRKTKLTLELTEQLVSMLRAGVPAATACARLSVSKSAYHEWLAADDPLHARFAERVREAQATGEALLVTRIAAASTENWQAAAWLLERTVPERYARLSQRALAPEQEKPDDPFAEFVTDELAERRGRPA